MADIETLNCIRTIINERRSIAMRYEKPEIVQLGPASESIQNNLKGIGVVETHAPFRPTNGAYQADE